MLRISKEEWKRKKKHGYTSYIDGQPYILTLDNGATVLAPVEIIKDNITKKEIEHDKRSKAQG